MPLHGIATAARKTCFGFPAITRLSVGEPLRVIGLETGRPPAQLIVAAGRNFATVLERGSVETTTDHGMLILTGRQRVQIGPV